MIIVRQRSSKDIQMGCQLNKHSQIQISLIKIKIGGAFWFGDDLSFVNNKNTPKQQQEG